MFVIGPGQTFSLRNGGTAEQSWVLVCADRVPVTADDSGRCTFCHHTLERQGVIVDTTGLPPRWKALFDGPVCETCASSVTGARESKSGRTT